MRLKSIRAIAEDLAHRGVRHPSSRSVALVLQDRQLLRLGEFEICLGYDKYNLQGPSKSTGFVSAELEVLRPSGATTLFEFVGVPVQEDSVWECRQIVEQFSEGDLLLASFRFSRMARVRPRETLHVGIRVYPPSAHRSTVAANGAETSTRRRIAPRVMGTHYRQVATTGTKHPRRAVVSLVVTDDRFPNPDGQLLCTYYARDTADGRRPHRGVAVVRITRERAGEEPVELIPPTRVPVEDELALLGFVACPKLDMDLQVGDVVTAKYRLRGMPRLRAGEEVAIHLQLNP